MKNTKNMSKKLKKIVMGITTCFVLSGCSISKVEQDDQIATQQEVVATSTEEAHSGEAVANVTTEGEAENKVGTNTEADTTATGNTADTVTATAADTDKTTAGSNATATTVAGNTTASERQVESSSTTTKASTASTTDTTAVSDRKVVINNTISGGTVSNVDAKGTIQSVDSMITVDEVRDPIFKGKNTDYSMILMDIRYPKLIDFSDNSGSTMNTIIDCVNKQCKDAADDYITDYEKMARDEYEDKTDWEDGAYFYNAGGYLRRVDDKVFSMVEGIESYAHGAHECYNFDTFNYDVATGKEITLENLVSDKEALYNAIKKELSEKYDASLFLEEDTLTETLHDYVCDAAYGGLKFSIEKDGVSFWFGNYDLTAYVYGCQMVTVPFKGNEGLFNKEYVTTEEDYVKTVVPGVDYKLSSGHSLSVLEGYDQYDYVVLDITYDDVSNKVKEIEGYDNQQTYLVHKSGKDYLYCQARGYSEDDELLIYALGGAQLGTPKHPAEAVKLGCAMIDPKKVNMYLRVDVLSTMNIMKEFYIGEDGMPVTDQAYYELGETGNELTLLRDLTAEVAANENSDAYTSEVLKAGTKMKIYRTNGKDLIDLILNDGRIVRLHIDFSQYPHKINGTEVDEFELFDGIAYYD